MTKITKISHRQVYFYLACIAPVGKLIVLPNVLASSAKNDLLFPILAQYLLQAAIIFCVLLLAKRGMNFYELLANTFGKVVAKILVTIFSLFLFYAALLPVLEQKIFIQNIFYDTLPSLIAFAPFFVFAAYLMSKPLASYGRTWDVLAPLAIVGLAGVLILSVGSADYSALLPVGATGIQGFLSGGMSSFAWFFDGAILLALLGKFEYEKGMAWKGASWYLAGGAAVLLFLATLYGIFQETAINQLFAFAQMSKYFAGITVLGRVDYIFIFGLAMVMAFYCLLPAQAGIDMLLHAYGKPKYLPTILGLVVAAVYFTIAALVDFRFADLLEVISQTLFWIFPIFTVLIPPLCLLLRRKRREIS